MSFWDFGLFGEMPFEKFDFWENVGFWENKFGILDNYLAFPYHPPPL